MLKSFHYGESLPVTNFFNLVLFYNRGVAFSLFATWNGPVRWVLIIVGLIMVALIIGVLKQRSYERCLGLGLSLILGGALGNIFDRVMYGHVIDYLDFYFRNAHWPAFNLADTAICGGVFFMIVNEFCPRRFKKA